MAATGLCALHRQSGGLAGFLSGLLGVGGGFVMLPALRRYTDLPPAQAVASSLTVIALLSATGAAAAALQGAMSWPAAAPFAAGTLAGMLAGGKFAMRMAGPPQQRAFAALTVLVALGMIGKTLL